MNIVLLEPLGVPGSVLDGCVKPLLAAGHTFRAYPKDTDCNKQIEHAKDADVIMIANTPLKGEVIKSCTHLKFIDVAFTGVDHVDLAAAREAGVKVSNAAGYSTQAVAELALCMMLSLLRHVPDLEACCREGKTKDGIAGLELSGKTVGIIGTGAIGQKTAELCHAFGCSVLGYRRRVRGDEPNYIRFVPLDELLSQSDIVSLHCPLNDSSRGMINRESISKMKSGAILINVARGPIVDSAALAEALNSGRLGGAGIDVFENEPPLTEDHPLLHSKNTLVTPHSAFATAESMEARCKIVFNNITQWIAGHQINVIL